MPTPQPPQPPRPIHYSGRLDWQSPSNPLSRVLREKRRLGVAVCDLTASNPTRVGLAYPDAALAAAFAAAATAPYSAEPRGLPAARDAVAAYYAERGHSVAPEDLLLTCSTSEAYAHLFRLLADPGDVILAPQPCYPLFDYLAGLDGLRLLPYPSRWEPAAGEGGPAAPGRWRIDLAALAATLAGTERVRAILLVSPANPTGSMLSAAEAAGLAALARRHGVPVIIDEVFADYPLAPSAAAASPFLDGETPAFVLNGLSKICGLPQMKLGWIAAAGPEDFRYDAMARLELIGDTFLSVSGPTQHAAPALLGEVRRAIQPAIRARLAANLSALYATLGASALVPLPVEGGWYAMVGLPPGVGDEDAALDLLVQDDTLVHPGYLFDASADAPLDHSERAYLVLSLLPAPADFRRGVAALGARWPRA